MPLQGMTRYRPGGVQRFPLSTSAEFLTPWRRLKTDPSPLVLRCLGWFCVGRGDAAEVFVFEPVAVSFECG